MAFNVERKGSLKLMQGQRRSFEQLGRGGSLVQLQERSFGLSTSEAPSSQIAGTWSSIWGEGWV